MDIPSFVSDLLTWAFRALLLAVAGLLWRAQRMLQTHDQTLYGPKGMNGLAKEMADARKIREERIPQLERISEQIRDVLRRVDAIDTDLRDLRKFVMLNLSRSPERDSE